jgi:2-hydroxycyclohexanecarboxyl-CoA dehydrogenase
MARRSTTDLTGTVALVTGAGSGIGRVTALALAERAATVLCADIDGDAADKTAIACEERGAGLATAHLLDVTDRAAVEALARDVQRDHGALDVLVNNAGVGITGRFLAMSGEDWEWIRGVNLDGVVHCCAAFVPAMVERGRGQVVNISSGLGYTPTATEPAYVTTKAAVLALSQCLRADWREHGVGVTAICPGVINTPIVDHTRYLGDQADPSVRERTARMFRRGHSPEMVAAAVIAAVENDPAVVPVGIEARVGWYLSRFAPMRLKQAIARSGRR